MFRWLHLSDIHFQKDNDSFNDSQIRSLLPDYLASNVSDIDAVIISGDYRYAPKKEHTSAENVVDYIRSIIEKLKVDDDHVIMVPGNHDLERSVARGNHIMGTRKTYNPNHGTIDESVLTSVLKDFHFYELVQEHFNNSLKVNGPNPHSIIDMGNCRLLLLNTAVIAGQDDDEYHIILGSKYLDNLLDTQDSKITKPVIAVGHHGLDFFDYNEKKVITNYLEKKGVRLYLCGHEHANGIKAFGDNGKQVNVGCLKQDTENVMAGFSVGTLLDNGDVHIDMHKWDRDAHSWVSDTPNTKDYPGLYPGICSMNASGKTDDKVEKIDHPFSLIGHSLLGGLGSDGIMYVWDKNGKGHVESVAFNERLKLEPKESDKRTSAYTVSTSIGCQLSTYNSQCIFCQTGANNYYPLTAEDIALQCIFMAEYDSNCPSYPGVRDHEREFAFMGQGEPGCCYESVKRAILLNDYVMKKLEQRVSRYIISTCGMTDFMPSLIQDCKNGVFSNKVTLHFSLNTVLERECLMPINKLYDYHSFIVKCRELYDVTHDKIGVGVLLFVDYKTANGQYFSLDANKMKAILDSLDPEVFKIDLCTVNKTNLGSQRQLSNEDAHRYLTIAKDMGFESKIFASFGDSDSAGCGMLGSASSNLNLPGNTSIKHFNRAVSLLKEALENVH